MDRYIGLDAHSSSCTVAVVGPQWPAVAVEGTGDKRPGADRFPQERSSIPAPVSGRGNPFGLALRGVGSSCGGDRRGGRGSEAGIEERFDRCLASGRIAAGRFDRATSLQGAGRVGSAAGVEPGLPDGGARLGAGAVEGSRVCFVREGLPPEERKSTESLFARGGRRSFR